MTQQTISITRALVELQRFTERIEQSVRNGLFITAKVGRNKQSRFPTDAAATDTSVEAKIQGSFDKVDSLFRNRAAVKAAIVASNATTKVSILGQEMTVAEAIELKSQIPLMQTYVNTVSAQITQAKNYVEKTNAVLNEQIEKAAVAAVGDKTKVDAAVFESIANPRKDASEASLFDPAKAADRLEKLTESVSMLKSEIDFVLSESNARTTVTVDL
jgi:hypothetical protein